MTPGDIYKYLQVSMKWKLKISCATECLLMDLIAENSSLFCWRPKTGTLARRKSFFWITEVMHGQWGKRDEHEQNEFLWEQHKLFESLVNVRYTWQQTHKIRIGRLLPFYAISGSQLLKFLTLFQVFSQKITAKCDKLLLKGNRKMMKMKKN